VSEEELSILKLTLILSEIIPGGDKIMQKYLVGLVVILFLNGCAGSLPKEFRALDSIQRDMSKEKYEQALAKINRFEQTNPDVQWWIDMQIAVMRAEIYDKQKKTTEAIKGLEIFLGKSPYYPSYIYWELAKLYLKEGRTKDAEKTFDKMKRMEVMDLTIDIGEAYEKNKLFSDAEKTYNQLKTEFPDYYRIYTRLAGIYRQLGKVNPAVENYTRALELYPKETEALMWLGGLYVVGGEKQKAQELFQKAAKLTAGYGEETNLDQAICSYIDSPSYEKIINTMRVDMREGDLKKAVEEVKIRLKDEPQNLGFHFALVALYSLLEMEEEVKKEAKEIYRLAPHSKEAKITRMLIMGNQWR